VLIGITDYLVEKDLNVKLPCVVQGPRLFPSGCVVYSGVLVYLNEHATLRCITLQTCYVPLVGCVTIVDDLLLLLPEDYLKADMPIADDYRSVVGPI